MSTSPSRKLPKKLPRQKSRQPRSRSQTSQWPLQTSPSPSPQQESPSLQSPPRPKAPRRTGRKLLSFDRRIGARYVVGADEAGRGSLAGPLLVAGVLLDYRRPAGAKVRPLALLNDSKQLTHEQREVLFHAVVACAERISVHAFSPARIDRDGLHVCNLNGLRAALRALTPPGEVCLVDGFRLGPSAPEHTAVVDGDERSAAIAAASIVAKVVRDRLMRRLDSLFPAYGFASHVGYITPEHSARVRAHGPSACTAVRSRRSATPTPFEERRRARRRLALPAARVPDPGHEHLGGRERDGPDRPPRPAGSCSARSSRRAATGRGDPLEMVGAGEAAPPAARRRGLARAPARAGRARGDLRRRRCQRRASSSGCATPLSSRAALAILCECRGALSPNGRIRQNGRPFSARVRRPLRREKPSAVR